MTFKNTLKIVALCAALMPAIPAFSHGDEDHSKKEGPVKKEQKDWGIAGDAKAAKRTIQIKMTDNMRFSPDKIEVKLGETVKFVVANNGAVMHEFVFGTKKELDDHALQMIKFPKMELPMPAAIVNSFKSVGSDPTRTPLPPLFAMKLAEPAAVPPI